MTFIIHYTTVRIKKNYSFYLDLSSNGFYICKFSDEKSQSFLAFSVYSNGKKVLSYKKSKDPDTMQCLHGIRAISTQWVVIGHT